MATRKITLETLAAQMQKGFASIQAKQGKTDASIEKMDAQMERGFGAVAEDISKLATKEQIISLHTQVNSIETQLRGMQHVKLQSRVADIEEEVFGKSRA